MRKYKMLEQECNSFSNQTVNLGKGYFYEKIEDINNTTLSEAANNINKLTNIMTMYMNEISHVLSHLSIGNLNVEMSKNVNNDGDFKLIRNALYRITHSLQETFGELSSLAREVEMITEQSAESSTTIAENAQNQTNQVSMLTQEIHAIRDEVIQNANNMEHVAEETVQSKQKADYGLKQMDLLVQGMKEINQSSKDIGGVIQMIQEIANKTKLLSLNASIEAARAGLEGQGFAVVADEIGQLAVQTSEAVNRTAELIQLNTATIESNGVLVENTYQSFKDIDDSVSNISGIVKQTKEFSDKQLSSIDSIMKISDELLDNIQTDAAYAEESAAVTTNLTTQTENLNKLIEKFSKDNNSCHSEITSQEMEQIKSYLAMLVKEVETCSTIEEAEKKLQEHVDEYEMTECFYIINDQGIQTTNTIMNSNVVIADKRNFKPSTRGTDQHRQIYYREGMRSEGVYVSYEYISSATGSLCKTCTIHTEDVRHNKYLLCMDFSII